MCRCVLSKVLSKALNLKGRPLWTPFAHYMLYLLYRQSFYKGFSKAFSKAFNKVFGEAFGKVFGKVFGKALAKLYIELCAKPHAGVCIGD